MVANQKSQQEIYNELTRANKNKANDAMFAVISTYDGMNREVFEEWIEELDQACRISGHYFRTKIINKSKRGGTSGSINQWQLLRSSIIDKSHKLFFQMPLQ